MENFELEKFVDEAIKEAEIAFQNDEVPVGAVLVKDGKIAAKAHNFSKKYKNKLAHAEMILLDEMIKKEGKETLEEYTLVVTLEPCVMCYGACNLARLKEVIFVLNDDKFGYSKTLQNLNIFSKSLRNLNILKTSYRENDVKNLMQKFFQDKR
jgi:tRNA(adenine34) deaminase